MPRRKRKYWWLDRTLSNDLYRKAGWSACYDSECNLPPPGHYPILVVEDDIGELVELVDVHINYSKYPDSDYSKRPRKAKGLWDILYDGSESRVVSRLECAVDRLLA